MKTREEDCPKCHGRGRVRCHECDNESECEHCNGSGKVEVAYEDEDGE